MPSGRCLCARIQIRYTVAPKRTALCHCDNCKHYTGSMYSHNIVIPGSGFQVVLGQPKEITMVAASGKSITNCFCGDCGTTMYRYGDSFGGIDGDKVIQGGIMDQPSELEGTPPILEMFIEDRIRWVPSLGEDGVKQFEGMPPPPSE